MKHTRRTASVAAALVVLAVMAALWTQAGRERTDPPSSHQHGMRPSDRPPVAVAIAPVERGSISIQRTFTGSLRPGAEFDLATQVAGRIDHLFPDLGDPVKRGDVVARLDDDRYRFDVEQARAERDVAGATLAEAETALETRRRELERVARLREQRVASESELDAARAEHQSQQARVALAAAQVAQRTAALKRAELMHSYTVIRADWQGDDRYRFIGERFANEGSYVAANTPLYSIVRLDRLIAVFHATERDYPRLTVGRAVTVQTDALPGRRFAGRLSRMAPVMREASRQARIEITVDNPDLALKPGMFVRIEIELDRSDDTVVIPRDALIERPDGAAIFLADREGNRARYVEVETGLLTRERAEILNPSLDGHVITLGRHLLSDGSPITISGTDDEAGRPGPSGGTD